MNALPATVTIELPHDRAGSFTQLVGNHRIEKSQKRKSGTLRQRNKAF